MASPTSPRYHPGNLRLPEGIRRKMLLARRPAHIKG